jgi:DNA-binding HxlR family transcriptional regulator
MRSADLINQQCSIARPATLLGDPWTLVILRQAFSRVRRFDDFQRQLGISRSLLSERLGRLVEAGILERRPYKDEIRTREEYRLTQKGLDLYPALMALREWGDKYMADDGAPIRIRHRDCGGELHAHLSCERCGEEVGAKGAEVVPGPGLRVAS